LLGVIGGDQARAVPDEESPTIAQQDSSRWSGLDTILVARWRDWVAVGLSGECGECGCKVSGTAKLEIEEENKKKE
jgi:hypothetical protein